MLLLLLLLISLTCLLRANIVEEMKKLEKKERDTNGNIAEEMKKLENERKLFIELRKEHIGIIRTYACIIELFFVARIAERETNVKLQEKKLEEGQQKLAEEKGISSVIVCILILLQ